MAKSPRFKSRVCWRKTGKDAKKITEILRVKHFLRSVIDPLTHSVKVTLVKGTLRNILQEVVK